MRRLTLLGAAFALWLALGSVAHAQVRVDPVQVPFYARVIEGDKWTAAIFYRPPGCIPPGFNLVTFFDPPRVFGCGPMTMDGYAIFQNGPGIDPAPLLSRLSGEGEVPMWFVRTRAYDAATADGFITLAEFEALKPLRGKARLYEEVLRTDPDRTGAHFSAVAHGRLTDGRSFSYLTVRTFGQGLLLAELLIH